MAGPSDEALVTIREGIAEADAVGDQVAVARGLHNMLGCVSLHTQEGKAIVAALDAAAERAGYDAMIRTKHEDLQVEIAISDGDMAAAQAGLDSWMRRVGEVTPREAQWPALNQVTVWLEGGTHERGRCARRSSRRPHRVRPSVGDRRRGASRGTRRPPRRGRAAAPSLGRCARWPSLLAERRVDRAASRCGPPCRVAPRWCATCSARCSELAQGSAVVSARGGHGDRRRGCATGRRSSSSTAVLAPSRA